MTPERRQQLQQAIAALGPEVDEQTAWEQLVERHVPDYESFRRLFDASRDERLLAILDRLRELPAEGLSARQAYAKLWPEHVTRHEFRDVWLARDAAEGGGSRDEGRKKKPPIQTDRHGRDLSAANAEKS